MCGEATRVTLLPSPEIERLIAVLRRLSELTPAFTLVGGVAVVARLAEVHRATTDLDTVSDGGQFTEAVVALSPGPRPEGALFVDGVRIDAIEVADVDWGEIADVTDPGSQLFTAAHLWALKESSPVLIAAAGASALVSVAAPHALLATKLHAYWSPSRSPEKQGSDAWDVYRLAQMVVREGAHAFPEAPAPVRASLRWVVDEHWRKDPAKMAQRLRRAAEPGLRLSEREVAVLAELVLEALPPGS